jgi:hypothetical protein
MCDTWGTEDAARLAKPSDGVARAWINVAACAVIASVALLLSACSIDSRSLSMDPSGAAASAGSAGNGPGSGGSSSTPPLEVELPVCVYDEPVTADCKTLVSNAGFAEDTSGWLPEDGISATWDEMNASATGGSGSITVLNLRHGKSAGYATGASLQCVPVTPGKYYDLAADVFIAEGQGLGLAEDSACSIPPCSKDGYEGEAHLSVYFSDSADCSPPTTGNIFSEAVSETGKWIHVEATGRAPERVRSMEVRLDTLKPFREYFFSALYDNVFVRERE